MILTGKIIKGIAGFYYVHTEKGVYECKAKGVFRNKNIKPLVGDNVVISILDEDKKLGNIDEIFERKNELIRPAVANIDQALVVFASLYPAPNFNLLSRFLVMMEYNEIETVVCFNKKDQVSEERLEEMLDVFKNSGCRIVTSSALKEDGIEEIKNILKGKTTTLAGPSGVGKSTLLNLLCPNAKSETGEISEKIGRGKHTTRHSEIFFMSENTYIYDTPGFTNLDYMPFLAEDLKFYFPDFFEYNGKCRFNGCVHVNEPDCLVKEAVGLGKINSTRYEIYKELYEELKNKRNY